MKYFAVLATLAVLSAADGRRLFKRPQLFRPVFVGGDASGQADGSVTSGVSETAFGRDQIDSAVSSVRGQANGLGSSSTNTANADTRHSESALGVQRTSDTNAVSVQDSNGAVLLPVGGLFQRPSLFKPALLLGGAASGSADGSVTTGTSDGVNGFTRVTSVTSNADGSVHGSGSSVSVANASNQRTETVDGVSETSDTGAVSVQNTGR
ncbi:uncharacterized protein LOC119093704 [Pollicipes pollicipes]|uniref:uncharacterized protein LOC119093704 n=1 Tax=Pollicipes pollicipes TaxID=41117 RepID=UPI0018851EDA|nr:uncharacterized protein LOC119093704 [Pollicipes pollicipes]